MGKIGLTTTIPVEVILAAGRTPVDLNNILISSTNPGEKVEAAEVAGYPRNVCGWIKGLYTVANELEDLEGVIAVTQGDCSNTHALMETLELAGIQTIPFAYPYDRDRDLLKLQIEKLMAYFGVSWKQVNEIKQELDRIRRKVLQIDRLTWEMGLVSGFENHLFQVSCSDFEGDWVKFERKVDRFLEELSERPSSAGLIRLGYIGVPPIVLDLYDYLETIGARVVFNEVQRQFVMPHLAEDLVEQYLLYTYPYNIFGRLKDIEEQIRLRRLAGIIHYTQSFCFRQIEDLIVRKTLELPILSLEGDKPSRLDARSRLRIDAFIDILR
ncbi:MAG: 2-hydroxyacyl-CoA dehydratase [Firmicutes bacterium]|nr:2-hydroxyacyl-CoA dehydratase [Bacillota bacterium]